jgi:hypothetical protein
MLPGISGGHGGQEILMSDGRKVIFARPRAAAPSGTVTVPYGVFVGGISVSLNVMLRPIHLRYSLVNPRFQGCLDMGLPGILLGFYKFVPGISILPLGWNCFSFWYQQYFRKFSV